MFFCLYNILNCKSTPIRLFPKTKLVVLTHGVWSFSYLDQRLFVFVTLLPVINEQYLPSSDLERHSSSIQCSQLLSSDPGQTRQEKKTDMGHYVICEHLISITDVLLSSVQKQMSNLSQTSSFVSISTFFQSGSINFAQQKRRLAE